MTEAPLPLFDWGQRVQTTADLYNDGSYPDQEADALLASSGEIGEVVQVGRHTDSGAVVYMVEFVSRRVVGCLEPELTATRNEGAMQ